MSLSLLLFFIFTTLCIISSIFIILANNPVFSIFFLIYTFFNVSCLLFLFGFEFLPISFIVIYVGAIGVLFLFVLMMLNIKLAELQESSYAFFPISIILGLLFIIEISCLIGVNFNFIELINKSSLIFLSDFTNINETSTYFLHTFSTFSNIKQLSYSLFSKYLYAFILSGFVLLLAMVSAILLTLQKKFINKTQNVYTQLLRDFNSSLIIYR